MVKQWNSDGGTVLVEQCGGTLRWNSVGGTAIVAQWWWNSVLEQWESVG